MLGTIHEVNNPAVSSAVIAWTVKGALIDYARPTHVYKHRQPVIVRVKRALDRVDRWNTAVHLSVRLKISLGAVKTALLELYERESVNRRYVTGVKGTAYEYRAMKWSGEAIERAIPIKDRIQRALDEENRYWIARDMARKLQIRLDTAGKAMAWLARNGRAHKKPTNILTQNNHFLPQYKSIRWPE